VTIGLLGARISRTNPNPLFLEFPACGFAVP